MFTNLSQIIVASNVTSLHGDILRRSLRIIYILVQGILKGEVSLYD